MGTEISDAQRRYSGIDLLKVLSVFAVIIIHILNQCGTLENLPEKSVSYFTGYFIYAIVLCMVNCFAMSSGFLLCKKKVKYSRASYVWVETVFYGLVITAAFFFLNLQNVSAADVAKTFFPIINNSYWYVTAYIGVVLISPFINKLMLSLDRRQTRWLMAVLFLMFSVLSGILRSSVYSVSQGYSFFWIAFMYMTGAAVRLHKPFENKNKFVFAILFAVGILLTFALPMAITRIIPSLNEVINTDLLMYSSPTMAASSFFAVLFFTKVNIKNAFGIKSLKILSKHSLGVYLIHATPALFYQVFPPAFSSITNGNVFMFVLKLFGGAAAVFLVCTAIDIIRYHLFKLCRIDKFANFAYKISDSIFD
ncbi:MAG: acyltransferase family protein [Firmicutes bacterium]|nr:acyltransferase family protein [Bacillota bacterium]